MKITRRVCLNQIAGVTAMAAWPAWAKQNAPTMMTRTIPSTGENLPIVGVGTWQTFDVGNTPEERNPLKEVLKILIEKGGSVIDSSPMYGRSEQVAGELSDDLNINKNLFIATKVWTSGKDSGIRQMNNSLRLLKRNKLDLMQIHNLLDWETHLKTLRTWKEEERLRYVGITHYTESAYRAIEQIMNKESIDFLQINYSILSRKAEERLFPLAQEKKIGIIVNQPFESGSLFQRVRGKALPSWLAEFDVSTWAQFFLKFILSHPAVTCVIPGTAKAGHMVDNAQAGFGRFPDPENRKRMIKLIEG